MSVPWEENMTKYLYSRINDSFEISTWSEFLSESVASKCNVTITGIVGIEVIVALARAKFSGGITSI